MPGQPTFKGALASDGQAIEGSFTQGGASFGTGSLASLTVNVNGTAGKTVTGTAAVVLCPIESVAVAVIVY